MVFIVWAQTSMLDSAWGGPSRPATPPVPLRSGAASLALPPSSSARSPNQRKKIDLSEIALRLRPQSIEQCAMKRPMAFFREGDRADNLKKQLCRARYVRER